MRVRLFEASFKCFFKKKDDNDVGLNDLDEISPNPAPDLLCNISVFALQKATPTVVPNEMNQRAKRQTRFQGTVSNKNKRMKTNA
jgi:hypothetical protein